MKYYISQDSYHRLKNVYMQSKPSIGLSEVRGDIVSGFILTKLVWIRNYHERLKKAGLATREIYARARANLGRRTPNHKKECSRLMQMRIGAINQEIRAQKRRCNILAERVEYSFKDQQSRQEYIWIKRVENS